MPQNLSTSNFSGGKYLLSLVAALAATIGALIGLSSFGVWCGLTDLAYHANYRFQLSKIERSSPVETLFVGDSSLGALLDTEAWSRAHGRPALHLALTGSDGYAGSLNMARRSVHRLRPRNLVIVHTLDMMTRDVAYLAFLQSNPDAWRERDIPLYTRFVERFQLYSSREFVIGTLRGMARAALGAPARYIGKEYIRLPNIVGAPHEIGTGKPPALLKRQINPEKLFFLKQLADLCHAEELNCIYAHGPLYDESCRLSQEYIRAVEPYIASTGIRLVHGTPLCVRRDDLGDAIDHIRQDRKVHFTQQYYELIRPYLAASDH